MATNAPAVCDVVTGLRPNVPRDNLAPDAIETRKGMGSNRNAALFGKFSTKNWNGMKKKRGKLENGEVQCYAVHDPVLYSVAVCVRLGEGSAASLEWRNIRVDIALNKPNDYAYTSEDFSYRMQCWCRCKPAGPSVLVLLFAKSV